MDIKEIPLRERKFAQTKLAIMNTAFDKILEKPLSEISVKEICDESNVSEGTFFNYFPKKSDLLLYFIQVWALEMNWHAKNKIAGKSGLEAIELIFLKTADMLKGNGIRIMDEIIAFFALTPEVVTFPELSVAEKLVAFPELSNIEAIPAREMKELFLPNLELAIEKGELPSNIDYMQAIVALNCIFFGVPMALRLLDTSLIGEVYMQQLGLLWNGLRGIDN
jgi:AcrR family transcriptional regulator